MDNIQLYFLSQCIIKHRRTWWELVEDLIENAVLDKYYGWVNIFKYNREKIVVQFFSLLMQRYT